MWSVDGPATEGKYYVRFGYLSRSINSEVHRLFRRVFVRYLDAMLFNACIMKILVNSYPFFSFLSRSEVSKIPVPRPINYVPLISCTRIVLSDILRHFHVRWLFLVREIFVKRESPEDIGISSRCKVGWSTAMILHILCGSVPSSRRFINESPVSSLSGGGWPGLAPAFRHTSHRN